jgi:hypothetical protein
MPETEANANDTDSIDWGRELPGRQLEEEMLDLYMLAVTGDHKCKRQNAKCKVQSGQASWLSATIDH